MKIVDIQWKRPQMQADGHWDVHAPRHSWRAFPCWWEVFTDSLPGMMLFVNSPNAVISKPACRIIRGNNDSTQIMSYCLSFLDDIPGSELYLPDGGYNINADLGFQVGRAGEWELQATSVCFRWVPTATLTGASESMIDKVVELIPLLSDFCARAENYWQYRSSSLLVKADPLRWQADQLRMETEKFSRKLEALGSPACD